MLSEIRAFTEVQPKSCGSTEGGKTKLAQGSPSGRKRYEMYNAVEMGGLPGLE